MCVCVHVCVREKQGWREASGADKEAFRGDGSGGTRVCPGCVSKPCPANGAAGEDVCAPQAKVSPNPAVTEVTQVATNSILPARTAALQEGRCFLQEAPEHAASTMSLLATDGCRGDLTPRVRAHACAHTHTHTQRGHEKRRLPCLHDP